MSFSLGDGVILARTLPLIAIAVVGADGTWYVLSKVPGRAQADHIDVALTFSAALQSLQPRYRALATSGTLSRRQAGRELLHAIWEVIAPPLGLRYDRIEASEELEA